MVPIHAILECRRCASWQILARLGVVGLEAQTHLWKFNVLVEVHTETVSAKLQILMEQWASCEGAWRHSEFFLQIRQKNRHRQFGSRRWMTKSELVAKYGSVAIATQIIEAKEHDADASVNQIRAHRDMHGVMTEARQATSSSITHNETDMTCAHAHTHDMLMVLCSINFCLPYQNYFSILGV